MTDDKLDKLTGLEIGYYPDLPYDIELRFTPLAVGAER